ncbi:MAG TPA: thiamine phosphate synthase [Campylobacterales bacterium]|nr:thiamine phosphate synthase [Campylobacterales bacterium]
MAKIYLIGDEKYSFAQTAKALTEDVEMFQLRIKNVTCDELYKEALPYSVLCRERGIKFIINDHLEVALGVGADGLHIGQGDLPYVFCRERFKGIIGLTVGNIEEAKEAFELGVDYIGLGAMYETTTKKNATVIGLNPLTEIAKISTCDIVAIGGIDTTNFQALYDAGADMLAVSGAVLGSENPAEVLKILRDR